MKFKNSKKGALGVKASLKCKFISKDRASEYLDGIVQPGKCFLRFNGKVLKSSEQNTQLAAVVQSIQAILQAARKVGIVNMVMVLQACKMQVLGGAVT